MAYTQPSLKPAAPAGPTISVEALGKELPAHVGFLVALEKALPGHVPPDLLNLLEGALDNAMTRAVLVRLLNDVR